MSPAEFMNEIVLPTAIEFRDARRDRRRAYLACVMTFAVREYLEKQAGERDVGGKMRAAADPAYDVVRSICNGTKHVRTDSSHVIAFASGGDYERPPAIAGQLQAGVSKLGDTIGGREIAAGPTGGADVYVAVVTVLKAYVAEYPAHFVGCDLSAL